MNKKAKEFLAEFIEDFVEQLPQIVFICIGFLSGGIVSAVAAMYGVSNVIYEMTAEKFEMIPMNSISLVLIRGFLPIGAFLLLVSIVISLLNATRKIYFPKKPKKTEEIEPAHP